ncbi:MAG: nitroreductase family protein [Pseudomonadota bacterium]
MSGLGEILALRYGDQHADDPLLVSSTHIERMAARGSVRRFADRPVDMGLIQGLCAVALAAPTKSDLQQRDIVIIQDPAVRGQLDDLVSGQQWVVGAPAFLVFCGNNRRQRQLHDWRERPFVNDHLDAFVNAVGDAAIALATFVTAAEAVGLGTCPVSAVRNRAEEVSALLRLPDHVFPFAGLALGWPAEEAAISLRLPLSATVHVDRFDERDVEQQVQAYDSRRAAAQPYASQRREDAFGASDPYTWSEDKARQYSLPERADFGAFVRRKGFRLD